MVSKAVLFAPADRLDGREGSHDARRDPAGRVALLPVGNRPVILHALEDLVAAGVDEVTVVSEDSVADDVQAVLDGWSGREHAPLHVRVDGRAGFLHALKEAAPALQEDRFAVHLCDSLHRGGLEDALTDPPGGSHDVVALVERPQPEAIPMRAALSSLQSAGVYVFGPGVLELAEADPAPGRWDVQIAAAAELLESAGGTVALRAAGDYWRYRRRPDVLLQANRFFLSGLRAAPTEAWLENTDLQGPVVIDPSARLRASTVRGPAIIGPDVEISDAYIGPYSSIGRGVVIENAEVEHSILLPGASVRHLGGRLEASVVGPGARVFRDFRLPRALRLNVGENAEIALT